MFSFNTNSKSSTMFKKQEKIKKYSGDLESPNARSRDATPLYSATATMPRLVTRR